MPQMSFKRRELINQKLKWFFSFFVFISILVVAFFLFEDYKNDYNSLKQSVHFSSDNVVKSYMDLLFGHYSSTVDFLQRPINLLVIVIWGLCCVLFASVLKSRLKPMFRFFFWISFFMVVIFNFWNFFVLYALSNPETFLINCIVSFKFSLPIKFFVLIYWGVFSFYVSYSYVVTKYVSIFMRLDYLFKSILRGNWDSIMFFRTGDEFFFVAKSFNDLKKSILEYLYQTDDLLILTKDKLQEKNFSAKSKEIIQQEMNSQLNEINYPIND